MEYNMKKIGERIHQQRKEVLDITMEELASAVGGITRQTVSKWEKGEGEITVNDLVKLCKIFNCDMGFLLCEYDCKTQDLQYIHDFTGLSEPAINKLHQWHFGSSEIAEKGQDYTKFLNLLLNDYYFDEFLDNITHYFMLANYTNPKFVSKMEHDEISTIINKHQMDAMTYIEEHDPSFYITAFIALKSNLRPDDLATHYLQEASDNIKYAIKEISRKQSTK